ncbi:MAG TPA: homoserine dehydrogenase [Acidimicrobiales bacterium]|jgi:homoserine dehydrogenase|nr:homoserine dehydrogenase [Acidimicrobiales bacterium]
MTSASPSVPVVRVAILGCGAVGAALVAHLQSRADDLAGQSGARIEIAGVAVADLSRSRPDHVPKDLLTDDAASLVADPSVDIVVELIGGLEPAGSLVRAALEAGKPVVTANKALLASEEGIELRKVAQRQGVDLLYEAAVAGAVPLVRVLRESLTGERIHRVMGIVNGTTNFILTKMTDNGTEYAEVLAEAQELGLAERDPTADVEGHDAAAKTAILAGIAMGYDVVTSDVQREGITHIGSVDIEFADRFDYVVKLLAVVERIGADEISARVHPAMVPKSHPLAGVRDAFNAVFIEGEWAGELMLYGQGAGGMPTASAVVGDLIDAVRNRLGRTTSPVPERRPGRIYPVADLRSAFYLTIDVEDRPGVLGLVSTVFGDHQVSIRSMEQIEQEELVGLARLIFLTHAAREGDMNDTIDALAALDAVNRVGSTIRVFGDDTP